MSSSIDGYSDTARDALLALTSIIMNGLDAARDASENTLGNCDVYSVRVLQHNRSQSPHLEIDITTAEQTADEDEVQTSFCFLDSDSSFHPTQATVTWLESHRVDLLMASGNLGLKKTAELFQQLPEYADKEIELESSGLSFKMKSNPFRTIIKIKEGNPLERLITQGFANLLINHKIHAHTPSLAWWNYQELCLSIPCSKVSGTETPEKVMGNMTEYAIESIDDKTRNALAKYVPHRANEIRRLLSNGSFWEDEVDYRMVDEEGSAEDVERVQADFQTVESGDEEATGSGEEYSVPKVRLFGKSTGNGEFTLKLCLTIPRDQVKPRGSQSQQVM